MDVRSACATALILVSVMTIPVAADRPAGDVLSTVSRQIAREPAYNSSPRYALIVVGLDAQTRTWMVEDGSDLYVDRNANGDLTDDGPAARLTGEGYLIERITGSGGSVHTDLNLRKWASGSNESSYGLSLKVDGRIPMYAGWFGTFWADSPRQVPIVHFGGPLTPRMLIIKEFVVAEKMVYSDSRRLALSFITPGSGEGAQARLSIAALSRSTIPVVQIDWPVEPGAPPLRTMHKLTQRCCYWCYYDSTFTVPAAAVPGTATVTVGLQGGEFPLPLTTNTIQVPVLAAPTQTVAR